MLYLLSVCLFHLTTRLVYDAGPKSTTFTFKISTTTNHIAHFPNEYQISQHINDIESLLQRTGCLLLSITTINAYMNKQKKGISKHEMQNLQSLRVISILRSFGGCGVCCKIGYKIQTDADEFFLLFFLNFFWRLLRLVSDQTPAYDSNNMLPLAGQQK